MILPIYTYLEDISVINYNNNLINVSIVTHINQPFANIIDIFIGICSKKNYHR